MLTRFAAPATRSVAPVKSTTALVKAAVDSRRPTVSTVKPSKIPRLEPLVTGIVQFLFNFPSASADQTTGPPTRRWKVSPVKSFRIQFKPNPRSALDMPRRIPAHLKSSRIPVKAPKVEVRWLKNNPRARMPKPGYYGHRLIIKDPLRKIPSFWPRPYGYAGKPEWRKFHVPRRTLRYPGHSLIPRPLRRRYRKEPGRTYLRSKRPIFACGRPVDAPGTVIRKPASCSFNFNAQFGPPLLLAFAAPSDPNDKAVFPPVFFEEEPDDAAAKRAFDARVEVAGKEMMAATKIKRAASDEEHDERRREWYRIMHEMEYRDVLEQLEYEEYERDLWRIKRMEGYDYETWTLMMEHRHWIYVEWRHDEFA